ncbi:MAG TPA: hypothetical protein DC057_13430 [Spirochaetia bacterium]|nr:hypothetical protein [Spirochaetia bacterium]
MSAFIVNKKHIDYLVSALYYSNKDYQNKYMDIQELNKIGQTLVNANYKSVNYRYNESEKPYKYIFSQIFTIYFIQTLKAINCLDYQSCEYPGWERSKAKKILNQIKDQCIYHLTDSNKYQWEIR